MFETFRYTLLWMMRSPGIVIWSLVFPIVLSSVFMLMFGPLDDAVDMDPMRVAVVDEGDSPQDEAFDAFIDAVGSGDDRLLDVTHVSTAAEAEALVQENAGSDDPYIGYVTLEDGEPRVYVVGSTSMSGMEGMQSSILTLIMDEYVSKAAVVQRIIDDDPMALADPAVIGAVLEPLRATVQVTVTESQPKESVRYYFALLGMAALFGGATGLVACQRLKPNSGALGARRAVGAVSHGRAVGGTLLACWFLSFACLLVVFAYLRVVVGVDFAGRDVACIAAIAVSALAATALGCAISAIPRLPEEGKSGILTGIVCFASLFAGLYGQPTMELADTIAAQFPASELVNPAAQITQAFYSIMYYDSYEPLIGHLAVLCIMAAVLFLLSAHALRRQRYASI